MKGLEGATNHFFKFRDTSHTYPPLALARTRTACTDPHGPHVLARIRTATDPHTDPRTDPHTLLGIMYCTQWL